MNIIRLTISIGLAEATWSERVGRYLGCRRGRVQPIPVSVDASRAVSVYALCDGFVEQVEGSVLGEFDPESLPQAVLVPDLLTPAMHNSQPRVLHDEYLASLIRHGVQYSDLLDMEDVHSEISQDSEVQRAHQRNTEQRMFGALFAEEDPDVYMGILGFILGESEA